MSDPLYTLCYAKGAVVAVYPGSVARTGCNSFVGTEAEYKALIDKLKLAPKPPPTPEQTFDAAEAAGFTYTVPGSNPAVTLTLDLGDKARAQFTGLVVLLNAAMAANPAAANSTQAIADKAGVLHALPASEIITMLLAYGYYYAGLFNALHAATTAPHAA